MDELMDKNLPYFVGENLATLAIPLIGLHFLCAGHTVRRPSCYH